MVRLLERCWARETWMEGVSTSTFAGLTSFAIASDASREGIGRFIEHRKPDFLGDTP